MSYIHLLCYEHTFSLLIVSAGHRRLMVWLGGELLFGNSALERYKQALLHLRRPPQPLLPSWMKGSSSRLASRKLLRPHSTPSMSDFSMPFACRRNRHLNTEAQLGRRFQMKDPPKCPVRCSSYWEQLWLQRNRDLTVKKWVDRPERC